MNRTDSSSTEQKTADAQAATSADALHAVATPGLGRLERVALREIWTSEASDFTPWLAREGNLALLGETLGLALELERQEQAVGPFRADIVCRDMGQDDHRVLIENQLERSDHTHLGQLLTYAAGLEAVTIVWIASRFTDEHRAALDWLNTITDESVSFFALEVELWRIGGSRAAPKFNIVSQPNDWSRSLHRAAQAAGEGSLSETRLLQRTYWAAFQAALDAVGGVVSGHAKPQPKSWMSYGIGRTSFSLNAVMLRPSRQVRAEVYISTEHAQGFFDLLRAQKDALERDLGYALDWEELPNRRDCRVSVALDEADPENEADWPRQHEWLASRVNELHRVFAPRIKTLSVEPTNTETKSVDEVGGDSWTDDTVAA